MYSQRYKSDIKNFLQRVQKYNGFNDNYAQMVGIEKIYKGHSGVSRSHTAPRRAALKRVHGSNDIAHGKPQSGDNRRAGFFYRFYSRTLRMWSRVRPSRISARNGNFVGGPSSILSVSGAAIPRGRPTVFSRFSSSGVSRNHK